MKALYDVGYALAKDGFEWEKLPPSAEVIAID